VLVDREPVGVIEAKRDKEGQRIAEHAHGSAASALPA
jgi:hypothetical protein